MKILYFHAIWCPGCLVMHNTLEKCHVELGDMVIESYSYDDQPLEVEKWQVGDVLPVLIFLDSKGDEVGRMVGEKSKKELLKGVEEMRSKQREA